MHNIKTIAEKPSCTNRILIIYTGGTLGMRFSAEENTLISMNYADLLLFLPELKQINACLDFFSVEKIMDSSNVSPTDWQTWAAIIAETNSHYEAFIFLHGTDTMAYSASMLSYMLQGINKPVIFTGAQLPLGSLRNDAKRNILTSLELALFKDKEGNAMIKEVVLYFNNVLLRGNRAKKTESNDFDAFSSKNYPALATTGVNITFNEHALWHKKQDLTIRHALNTTAVAALKLYPGIGLQNIKAVFNQETTKIVVLETFGAGNAPTSSHFLNTIKNYIHNGGLVLNISQCEGGAVQAGKYETNKKLHDTGVLNGKDMTFEAAITKSMFVLENYPQNTASYLLESFAGEISD